MKCHFVTFVVFIVTVYATSGYGEDSVTICQGTERKFSVPGNTTAHYEFLKNRYEGCTHVNGSLEITWLVNTGWDLTFLANIRDISGYFLVFHVDVDVVLPKLKIIRGQTLYKSRDREYALYVALNRMSNLELPALSEVVTGNVGVLNNVNLCHIRSINWDDILGNARSTYTFAYNYSMEPRECSCDASCSAGCWGAGAHNCQNLSKVNCSPQCHNGRCYGTKPRECCSRACVGGCSGSSRQSCNACQEFGVEGECPLLHKAYNSSTSCEVPVFERDNTIIQCVRSEGECPSGFYLETLSPHEDTEGLKRYAGYPVCRKCHPRCKRCSAYGYHTSVCEECMTGRNGEQCT